MVLQLLFSGGKCLGLLVEIGGFHGLQKAARETVLAKLFHGLIEAVFGRALKGCPELGDLWRTGLSRRARLGKL